MRDARVEDVEHVSDSDSEEKNDDSRNLTVAIYPQHQVTGVSIIKCLYIIMENCECRCDYVRSLL